MRRVTLVVGVLGAVLAVVGFELGDTWPLHLGAILGGSGTVGTLAALGLQYRQGSPFEYPFTGASWKPYGPDEVCLKMAGPEHGKGGSPSVIVYERDEATGGYQEVGCGIEVEPSGRVYVVAAESVSLSRKVVIR